MRIEIGVMLILSAYFAQKSKDLKPNFGEIIETIRQKHFNGKYGEREFFSIVSRLRRSMKRNGVMAWILRQKELGQSWEEISDMFDEHVSIVQTTIPFSLAEENPNYTHHPSIADEYIAFQHLHDAGGILTPDILSPYEEELIKG